MRVQVRFSGNLFRICCKQNIIDFIYTNGSMLSQFASQFEMELESKKINFTYGNLGHLKLESEELWQLNLTSWKLDHN
jgi:hypothetical protein